MSQKGRTPPAPIERFMVTSGYGYHSKAPFVQVELHGKQVQMTPAKARELALNLLSAADAAESDGFIVEFIAEQVGLDEEGKGTLLWEFRAYRDRQRKAQAKHDWPEAPTG